ncbi:MAG: ferritin [Deltaproteobacteria bacterium]|nr:ferritin [Deltaproteobacteria bacterium]
MLKPKIKDALTKQLNFEFESAYVYLGMAAYCQAINLDGFAHWFQLQTKEEVEHGMKIWEYLSDHGSAVSLSSLPEPKTNYASIKEVLEVTLAHEQQVTASIQNIYKLAVEEQDFTTQSFLNWFLEEQVEEEATATKILEQVGMVGPQGHGIFFLDRELGRRE